MGRADPERPGHPAAATAGTLDTGGPDSGGPDYGGPEPGAGAAEVTGQGAGRAGGGPAGEAAADPSRASSRRPRRDAAVALGIGAGYTTLLAATASGISYTRDEGIYSFAERALEPWFVGLVTRPREAISRAAIDSAWRLSKYARTASRPSASSRPWPR